MMQALDYLKREYSITTAELVEAVGDLVFLVEGETVYAKSRKDSDVADARVARYVAERDAKAAVAEAATSESVESAADADAITRELVRVGDAIDATFADCRKALDAIEGTPVADELLDSIAAAYEARRHSLQIERAALLRQCPIAPAALS